MMKHSIMIIVEKSEKGRHLIIDTDFEEVWVYPIGHLRCGKRFDKVIVTVPMTQGTDGSEVLRKNNEHWLRSTLNCVTPFGQVIHTY